MEYEDLRFFCQKCDCLQKFCEREHIEGRKGLNRIALFDPVFKDEVQVETYGNVLAAIAFLQGVAVEDLPDETLLDERDPDYQMIIAISARKAP